MMMVRAVEAYWLALTFELKTPSAKLNELRPKFQQAWDKRKKAFETARTSRDFAAFHASLEKVNADLESALKKSLGTTQFKKLKETAENIMIPRRARINYSKSGKGG
jgi:PBP1b-binding outer membrane lipoprotein LpoB